MNIDQSFSYVRCIDDIFYGNEDEAENLILSNNLKLIVSFVDKAKNGLLSTHKLTS